MFITTSLYTKHKKHVAEMAVLLFIMNLWTAGWIYTIKMMYMLCLAMGYSRNTKHTVVH
jgi:hypothetical protein